ncbi:MAG TPA: hypothetical protein VN766_02495 [Stellaceae bacterium]|jgi:hypothetical protein|nr:hypothetical protein [Stellaceae bacterium]
MTLSNAAVAAAALAVFALTGLAHQTQAQERAGKVEYIDIRWDGTDRMCVVYPDGRVDFFGKDLKDIQRPDDANKRAFYLTIEMNRLAAQGYEFVAMISDEILMKRTVAR